MRRHVFTVDVHTQGEPTRVVVGGLPHVPGADMVEKRRYLMDNMDHLRTALLHEPRGHNDMFGSILFPPTTSEAHLGVVFMDSGGYLNMCGHGLIGAVTAAVETGIIEACGENFEITMETPAGLISCEVAVQDDRVESVSFTNVPAFVYAEQAPVKVPLSTLKEAGCANADQLNQWGEEATIHVDVAFGGSFFGIVSAQECGIKLCSENATKLIKLGVDLRHLINEQLQVQHPELEHINSVDLVEFSVELSEEERAYKNATIFGEGQLDRSPCGTGTCAKMAVLYQQGKLQLEETFKHDSILDTRFYGKVLSEAGVNGYSAIIPEITSYAYITGFNQLVLDERDPLWKGFRIK